MKKRSSKYAKLTEYLADCGKDNLELTFDEIADITGYMPDSAYKYTTLWYNGGALNKSWLDAGYKASIHLSKQEVSFYKSNSSHEKSNSPQREARRINQCTLDIDVAIDAIRTYHLTIKDNIHTRYRSWEHCYKVFAEHKNDSDKQEYLCLHLASYLASWGMLRNSFLLDFDHLVHLPVVRALTGNEFLPLFENLGEPNIELVFKAVHKIKKGYGHNDPSETLITKILMGVFACCPAYDDYFKASARKYKVCSGNFNENSLSQVWDYYHQHKKRFEQINCELRTSYPPMKLLDMALWQIGFIDKKEQNAK